MSRYGVAFVLLTLSAGCAGPRPLEFGRTVPYKAVVRFQWKDQGNSDRTSAREEPEQDGSLSREWLATQILEGFAEYGVFSDFVRAGQGDLLEVARAQDADLLLLVGIGKFGEFNGRRSRLNGLGLVDVFLWLGTGFLCWWVPDVVYSTDSDVEIRWRFLPGREGGPEEPRRTEADTLLPGGWPAQTLSSGEYALALWDRAKPWSAPLAYLQCILIPPVWAPLEDEEERDRSLKHSAAEHIRRELAATIKAGRIGAAGAPLEFLLEMPENGVPQAERTVTLRFKYADTGSGKSAEYGLRSLEIHRKRAGESEYTSLKAYDQQELRELNRRIRSGEAMEEKIELARGANLIRFLARDNYRREGFSNTVLIPVL